MTIRQTFAAAALAISCPASLFAGADPAEVDALIDVMALDDLLVIMQEEGIDYGLQIAEDFFPSRRADDWAATVEQIYSLETMTTAVRDGMTEALDGADLPAITSFFDGELGREIITLEIAARRALMDESVEEASKEAAALALIDETPRALLITSFVETNDLIETNVVGALNANFAFFQGLTGGTVSDDELLADVWQQEPDIRQNTSEWVYSYAMLAYQPLRDDQIQAYIDFSETVPGQQINQALFAAFDGLFEDISGALGRAAASYMVGEDL